MPHGTPSAHLVRTPDGPLDHDGRRAKYMVRETSCYALGLLMRDGKGDRARAAEGLEAVLKEQFLDKDKVWYGTFRRTPEEPDPSGENTVMWRNYDPNWREFIGTTFQMILIEYPDRISKDLASRMYGAIDRAIVGEMKQGRLLPTYSNIALMYGALWDFAATHDNSADWKKQSALVDHDRGQLLSPAQLLQRVQLAHILWRRHLRPRPLALLRFNQ